MNFFPLQKLKGTQSARTPDVWVVHLEEESTNKEEGTESENPNGIEGITEEFVVFLARQWRMLSRRRNAATTAAAWSTLSMIACWWRHPEQIHI